MRLHLNPERVSLMRTIPLGSTGEEIPVIGQGTWRMGAEPLQALTRNRGFAAGDRPRRDAHRHGGDVRLGWSGARGWRRRSAM